MNGRNSKQDVNAFRLEIDLLSITEITELAEGALTTQLVNDMIEQGAPIEDIRTAEILIAMQIYMKDRNVDPGFEVIFE